MGVRKRIPLARIAGAAVSFLAFECPVFFAGTACRGRTHAHGLAAARKSMATLLLLP